MKNNDSNDIRANPKQHFCKSSSASLHHPGMDAHRSHASDVWRMLPGGGAAAAEVAPQVRTGQQAAVYEARKRHGKSPAAARRLICVCQSALNARCSRHGRPALQLWAHYELVVGK